MAHPQIKHQVTIVKLSLNLEFIFQIHLEWDAMSWFYVTHENQMTHQLIPVLEMMHLRFLNNANMKTLGLDLSKNTHYLELIYTLCGLWDFLKAGFQPHKGLIIVV